MMAFLKLFSLFRNAKKKHKKKFRLFFGIILATIVFCFCMDDDLYYYYLKKDNSSIIQDNEENNKRKVYKVISKDDLKDKSGTGGLKLNADGSLDASEQEILDAINEIVGTFDDAYIKGDCNMTADQVNTIKTLLPYCIMVHLKNPSMYAATVILQKAIESEWQFTSPTDIDTGKESNNYFGIKPGGKDTNEYWKGDSVSSWTYEYDTGGNKYRTVQPFRAYDSLLDSVMDYGVYFFEENERYKGGEGCSNSLGMYGDDADYRKATDAVDQVKRIQNAGYSPGSESFYISTAESIYNDCDLGRFDKLADEVLKRLTEEKGGNSFGDGEWIPAGDTNWLDEAGVDKSQLNSKRLSLIQEGRLLYGVCYIYGGYTPPTKKADGTYEIDQSLYLSSAYPPYNFDCSAYVNYCYKTVFNVDIGRATPSQMYSPLLETVSFDEVKPGDLWYRTKPDGSDGGHVVMVLSKNADGTCNVQHTNTTWKVEYSERGVVHFQANYYVGNGIFKRLKGIDD